MSVMKAASEQRKIGEISVDRIGEGSQNAFAMMMLAAVLGFSALVGAGIAEFQVLIGG